MRAEGPLPANSAIETEASMHEALEAIPDLNYSRKNLSDHTAQALTTCRGSPQALKTPSSADIRLGLPLISR